MIPLKSILTIILGLNVLFLFIAFYEGKLHTRELPSINDAYEAFIQHPELPNSNYSFIDPPMAYQILTQFDVPEPDKELQKQFENGTKSYLGIKPDDEYCAKQRAYFVKHPESLFEEMNIMHCYPKDSFFADTVSTIGNDLHSENVKRMTKKDMQNKIHEIKLETSNIYTSYPPNLFFHLTKEISCLFQETNQIPGQKKLSAKDLGAQAVTDYMKKYEDRPQCLNYDKFFPKTLQLFDRAQCKEFFQHLLSPEYAKLKEERKILYIKKIPGTHRGEGVQPLDLDEELKVQKQYNNGELCGKIRDNVLMQHYVHNSLLLHGRKFDFRMYLLIASANPIIAYYHDGFLRVTLAEYDANSKDKKVLLTNLSLNKQIYNDVNKGNLYEGKTEEDLKIAQQWSFERLQNYLLASGVIKDPNWLDNYLRPEFKKALIHLVRLSSDKYVRRSEFYGLYGVDFMLDTNLNLWFIEANSGPALEGYSEPMGKIISKMITDHFEIVYGILRSRAKRAISFVNKLIQEGEAYKGDDGKVVISNFEQNKEMFDSLMVNRFEEEFKVSKENGFVKIIDETEQDIDVYQGLIDPECL